MLKLLISLLLLLAVVIMAAPRTEAFDFFRDTTTQACTPDTSSSPVCKENPKATENPAVHIIQVATSVLALLAGALAVIMIIVSGFTLVTSAGNQEAVTNSRKRIVNAMVGLVIVALAWTIIRFITDHIIK